MTLFRLMCGRSQQVEAVESVCHQGDFCPGLCPNNRQSGMYGPPPYCKRKMKNDIVGLRECIRPLCELLL